MLLALWKVGKDQHTLAAGTTPPAGRRAYRALALTGFLLTWAFMLVLAWQDLARYPSFGAWATQSNLFFDAYRSVTETPIAWWWSQQLMLWAPAAVLFFHAESVRQRFSYWAYAWVGMCVAISVALPLFLMRREAQRGAEEPATASAWLGLCLVVAASATVWVPAAQGRTLQLCLLLMHGGVLLSLLPLAPRVASATLLRLLYLALGLIATLSWWQVNAALWLHTGTPVMALWTVIWNHPAQSSISLDVMVTVTICLVWVHRQDGRSVTLLFLLGTGLLSLGGAFCLHQLWRLRKQT
ncbi:MAG: hypothetical protein CFE43_08785 [Burkholderiales bacterium PBB3]|nr:MAG: hypothetical protein CFE43_08785 [Burkholderiales bacterium PBB3]